MKSIYRTLNRRRVEAALRIRVQRPSPSPALEPPFDAIPAEVIDLATGPYEARFPDLAAQSRRRKHG